MLFPCRYVEKVHALDPETRGTIPWQPRPYTRKRSHDTHVITQGADRPQPKKLCSPLLEQETAVNKVATCSGYKATSNLQLETKLQPSGGNPPLMTSYKATQLETKPQPSGSSPSPVTSQSRTNTSPPSQRQRLPGLDYSSSEEES